jgi:uncharacterized protein (TIGR02270 family)
MATSPRAFLIELYEEYLEEASFLYEQRRTLFENPEVSWKKIGEFEERLEAHIDGLIVGDKLALEVCKRHAAEGDAGELFACVCAFCRQRNRDLVLDALEQLDPDNAEKALAISDALKYELPDEWVPDLLVLLNSGDPKFAPVLARAFGYRRIAAGTQLMTAVQRCTAQALPHLIWALGRLRFAAANEQLLDYLRTDDAPARSASALALLRNGEWRAAQICIDEARSHPWPVLALGLSGSRRALRPLTELMGQGPRPDCVIAVGLLGDPASIPLLVSALQNAETAKAASFALESITGAGLCETVFVPDEVDEDEGDRGDGRPFGDNVTRLSQQPEDWDRWWHANQTRFTSGVRYRHGEPMSPEQLVQLVNRESASHDLRAYSAEELVTNYGKDIGFEVDMPAKQQLRLLSNVSVSVRDFNSQFREGEWYCAGLRT